MKIKFGSIVIAGSGKIGGHVASKNRAGAYIRTKTTPVNPQTGYQTQVRNRLSTLATAWAGLTDAQRNGWNNAVGTFKSTNVFGDVVNPSGFNLFQKLNNNLAKINVAQINTPPVPVALPAFTTVTLTPAAGAQTIGMAFTATPIPAGVSVRVSATPAMAAGKTFVKNQFRFVSLIAAAAASPFALGAPYITRLGAVGAAGKRIWVKTEFVSLTTGQVGVSQIFSAVIAA